MQIEVTRIETFSAAHRLHSLQLSAEENARLYGKCNREHGHGHNYRLEVTVAGPVDPRTGMVVDLHDLKELIRIAVMEPFDHSNLDIDHKSFFTAPFGSPIQQPSTTENLLCVLERSLQDTKTHLFPFTSWRLVRLRLAETDKNIFTLTL
jgi:6-pyruvoyltetrahydropterin/6-carboxytetrahydropterin synthase